MVDDVTVSPDLRTMVLVYEKKPILRTAWTFRIDVDRMINEQTSIVEFGVPATPEYIWRKLKALWDERLLLLFYPPSVELDPLKVCITDMPATFEDFREEVEGKGYIDVQLIELIGEGEHGMPPIPPVAIYAHESRWQSTGTYSRRIAVLTDEWTVVADPAAANQTPIALVRRLGTNFYRITGTFDSYTCMHPGQLQRSEDNGVSWINVGPTPIGTWGVNSVAIAAGGVLWLCCCAQDLRDGTPQVWKSIDDGVNWTLVYETTTKDAGIYYRRFIDICTHPANANIIAVVGDKFAGILNTWYTINGGVDWARTTGGFNQSVGGNRRAVMTSTGRIVIISYTALGYSDNYGVSWVDSGEGFVNFQYQITSMGTVIFASGGDPTTTEIWRTSDYGATWTRILVDSDIDSTIINFRAMVYEPANDRLYIASNLPPNLYSAWLVFYIPDATGAFGEPVDVTLNLPDLWNDFPVALNGLTL